jgi:hypothetical protein
MIKKKKQVDPEIKQTLLELEEVIQRLGYRLRYEKGNFRGGHCIIKEDKLFVINSRFDIEKRISTIARNLNQFDLEEIFIKPHIRELIYKEASSKDKSDEIELESSQ